MSVTKVTANWARPDDPDQIRIVIVGGQWDNFAHGCKLQRLINWVVIQVRQEEGKERGSRTLYSIAGSGVLVLRPNLLCSFLCRLCCTGIGFAEDWCGNTHFYWKGLLWIFLIMKPRRMVNIMKGSILTVKFIPRSLVSSPQKSQTCWAKIMN